MTPERDAMPSPFDASIVIVVRDRAALLMRALIAMAGNEPGASFETIVVDDASVDATPALLRGVGGDFTALREDRARGFAAGCDRAAQAAQSEVIVVVREDLVATAGWLAPLLAQLHDERVGAVRARAITADGRDVVDPGWACLAVRRSALAQVGGFAATAAPGRAVKATLLEALSEHGWRVVDAPLSVLLALPQDMTSD
jgi:GT2 family glycosyltransferase